MRSDTRRLLVVAASGVVLLWLVLLGGLYLLHRATRGPGGNTGLEGRAVSVDGQPIRYWQVPAFACIDQQGRAVTDQLLRGRPWIADFVFTRCTTACPLLTAKMALLWGAIDAPDLGFVSFSVDPEYDTPAVLAQYSAEWSGDPRWLLLRMDPAALPEFSRAMNSPLQRLNDPVNPIVHSSYFFLVDDTGWVRGVYDSLDEDAQQRLVQDARALATPTSRPPTHSAAAMPEPTPATAAERGQALFHRVGCAACHDHPRLAPTLAGLFGTSISVETGLVRVDSAYVRQSIVEPGARTVAGYGTVMPSYSRHLSEAELADLVAYVATLDVTEVPAAGPPQPPAKATAVLDPVCQMRVASSDDTPHVPYRGSTYYFCSELCRDRFVDSPAAYVKAP